MVVVSVAGQGEGVMKVKVKEKIVVVHNDLYVRYNIYIVCSWLTNSSAW